MIFSNTDFTVVYVDPSIATAGDGSTPATALKNLPSSLSDFTDNTCYLIRRTSEDYVVTIPSGTNSNLKNILFFGMPISTDRLYNFVPDEAKTAWGSDTALYANMKSTTTSRTCQLP